jgi:WD40 repeat protein
MILYYEKLNRGHINGAHCLAFSPNSEILATGGEDTTVRLYDFKSIFES